MFYFGEIAAILICWLFYCELRWVLERKVNRACSRDYLAMRCTTFFDKLFFTPVNGKAKLGMFYYLNVVFFFLLCSLSVLHLLLGWMQPIQGVIKGITTAFVLILGLVGAGCSAGSTEELCVNKNITSKKLIFLAQAAIFVCEVIVILMYLYVAWVFIP